MRETGNLPLIIAHRGASALAPENTFAAFRQAIEAGADGIEFDVQLVKDNVPVVFHDFTLQRVGKRKERISNFTSGELQNLDIGSWFNSSHPLKAKTEYVGEKIPTLAEFFAFLSGYKGRLYLELKCETDEASPPLVEAVINEIRKTRSLLPNIILKSFDLKALALARKFAPEIRAAALLAPKLKSLLHKNSRLISLAQDCGASELSVHYSLATPKFVALANDENLPVTIWTADSPAWIKRARDRRIHAIITNNPARLIKMRRANAAF